MKYHLKRNYMRLRFIFVTSVYKTRIGNYKRTRKIVPSIETEEMKRLILDGGGEVGRGHS